MSAATNQATTGRKRRLVAVIDCGLLDRLDAYCRANPVPMADPYGSSRVEGMPAGHKMLPMREVVEAAITEYLEARR